MADRTATLTAVLVDAVSGPARKIQAEITGIGASTSRTAAILQGVGQGIGQELFRGLEGGLSTISHILPDLLDQGHAYLDQLQQIQLETGMTAEQTSTLVGALKTMGVPTEDIDTLMARLGSNIGRNEGLFRQLGVATRDSNGALLSAYVVFQNIRRAVQEHGESLLSTAAAQELFGRSGFKIIEALQATDAEWQTATENVRRWGGVVSQQAIRGADALGDTLASLRQGITDIGVNIAAAVDPYLRAFVDAFAKFVQAHLNEIVNFAVGVVNTVTGFISGLFGITNSLNFSTDSAAKGTARAATATDNFGKVLHNTAGGADAFTKSIQAQIRAIDAQTHALELAAERRRAIQERARLAESLAAAQAQLNDLRGNRPFLGGLSAQEQALALQKHAQDIVDAEKNVRDQRQAIGDFEADQKDRAERELLNREKQRLQDSLAAHKATNAAILDSGLRMGAGLDKGVGTVLGNLGIKSRQFGETAARSFQTGINAAKSFLDIILGSVVQQDPFSGAGSYRTGGIVGALGTVGDVLRHAGDAGAFLLAHAGQIPGFLRDVGFAFQPMADGLNALAQALSNLGSSLHGFLSNIPAAGGSLPSFGGWQLTPHGYVWVGGGSPNSPPPSQGHAEGGWVGMHGPELSWVGEREPELIVPQSRLGQMGGTTVVNFNSTWPPTEEQARRITEVIQRRLYFAAQNSPITARPNGAF